MGCLYLVGACIICDGYAGEIHYDRERSSDFVRVSGRSLRGLPKSLSHHPLATGRQNQQPAIHVSQQKDSSLCAGYHSKYGGNLIRGGETAAATALFAGKN